MNIKENSLSRIWSHNEKYDCGVITSFRKYTNCGYLENGEPCDKKQPPIEITKKENDKRNQALKADLIKNGFKGAIKLVGVYPEGGSTTKEISYFVVDNDDTGDLKKILTSLGEKYEQDSVLFIPKGSISNKDNAYLIGTNNCPNNGIKKGQKMVFNKGKIGYESPFYTSYVNGRPIIFEVNSIEYGIGFSSGTNAMLANAFSNEYDTTMTSKPIIQDDNESY